MYDSVFQDIKTHIVSFTGFAEMPYIFMLALGISLSVKPTFKKSSLPLVYRLYLR
ncbi:MAG: hypothetical protein U1E92_03115 [Moraxella osloensis]